MTHYQEQALCFTSIVCVCVCVCVCCIVLYCIVFILMGWDPPLPAIYPVVKAWDGLYLVARLVREQLVLSLYCHASTYFITLIGWLIFEYWCTHCTARYIHTFLPPPPVKKLEEVCSYDCVDGWGVSFNEIILLTVDQLMESFLKSLGFLWLLCGVNIMFIQCLV